MQPINEAGSMIARGTISACNSYLEEINANAFQLSRGFFPTPGCRDNPSIPSQRISELV